MWNDTDTISWFGSPRVLMLGDGTGFHDWCRSILEPLGYEMIEASCASNALEKVAREEPDMILLDDSVAGEACLKFARLIKADAGLQSIPIILVRESLEPSDVLVALEAGADEVLAKTVSTEEFVLRLRAFTRLQRTRKDLVQNNERAGEHARAMIVLLEYSRGIIAAQTLPEILDLTLGVIAELACARRVSVLMPDEGRRTLSARSVIGIDSDWDGRLHVAIDTSVVGSVFHSGIHRVFDGDEPEGADPAQAEGQLLAPAPAVSYPLRASEHIVGVLTIAGRQERKPFSAIELEYIDLVSNITAAAIHDLTARQARDEARDSIVIALANLAEHRDGGIGKHLERVTAFTVLLASELRRTERFRSAIDAAFISDLTRAVPLHDIGKVGIPDYILLKPGKLTPQEWEIMKTHTEIGAKTIRAIRDRVPDVSFLDMAEKIVRSHHELFDGTGYPDGLRAETIPLASRITTLADVYDALTSRRVYKEAIAHESAKNIIVNGSGIQFDPLIVQAFLKRHQEFAELAAKLADDKGPASFIQDHHSLSIDQLVIAT